MAWAQNHLRVLLGLYGVLRPLDAIKPYRLEMGSLLATKRGVRCRNFFGQNRLKAKDDCKEFSAGGYCYQPDQSDANQLVFMRDAATS